MIPQEFPKQALHYSDALVESGVFRHSSLSEYGDNAFTIWENKVTSAGGEKPLSFRRHIKESVKFHHMRIKAEEKAKHVLSNLREDKSCRTLKTVRKVRFEAEEKENKKKNVKVDVLGPLLRPSSEMSESEKEELWWGKSDYAEFKKNAITEISELYRASALLPGSYSATIKKVYQECSSYHWEQEQVLGPRTKVELTEWTRVALSRRGLEYGSVPFLMEARKIHRVDSIKSVIGLQRKMNNNPNFDLKLAGDTMRKFSERRTRSAKLFAQVLGEADAATLVEPSKTGRAHRRFTVG